MSAKRFHPAVLRILPLLLAALQAACSTAPSNRGGYYQDDGPHHRPAVDVSTIPDAVPRAEARSPGGNKPYRVFNKMYYPLKESDNYRARGIASWYGKKFHGRKTSNGETYDMYAMTAAHKTLPLPSYVRVRNLNNGHTVTVRVNDRGPFLENRLIDLSYAAAARLGIVGGGTGLVEVVSLTPGATEPPDSPMVATARDGGSTRNAGAISSATARDGGSTGVRSLEANAGAVSSGRAEPMGAIPMSLPPEAEIAVAPRLYLQVGAFVSQDNAEQLRQQLERADFQQVQVLAATHDNTTLYHVRIGPLQSVDASDSLAQRIAGHGIRNAFVAVE